MFEILFCYLKNKLSVTIGQFGDDISVNNIIVIHLEAKLRICRALQEDIRMPDRTGDEREISHTWVGAGVPAQLIVLPKHVHRTFH